MQALGTCQYSCREKNMTKIQDTSTPCQQQTGHLQVMGTCQYTFREVTWQRYRTQVPPVNSKQATCMRWGPVNTPVEKKRDRGNGHQTACVNSKQATCTGWGPDNIDIERKQDKGKGHQKYFLSTCIGTSLWSAEDHHCTTCQQQIGHWHGLGVQEIHVYRAVQWSWFARVNAICNLSHKKLQEVAASLPGWFLSRRV